MKLAEEIAVTQANQLMFALAAVLDYDERDNFYDEMQPYRHQLELAEGGEDMVRHILRYVAKGVAGGEQAVQG